MKHAHIPTIEELMEPNEFNIEELTDGYRISGIHYRTKTRTYDIAKNTLPSQTQDKHAEDALKAGPNDFIASNAPLVYAICRTLYHNRNGPKKDLVEKARETLEAIIGPIKPWINTLSRAVYNKTGQGKIIHDYKQKTKYYSKQAQLVGPNEYITEPDTEAEDYTHALLNTNDSMQDINKVFKWITGKESYAWRLNKNPTEKQRRAVALGVGNHDAFDLHTNGSISGNRPALGVRCAKTSMKANT